jgi:hypothetical protein
MRKFLAGAAAIAMAATMAHADQGKGHGGGGNHGGGNDVSHGPQAQRGGGNGGGQAAHGPSMRQSAPKMAQHEPAQKADKGPSMRQSAQRSAERGPAKQEARERGNSAAKQDVRGRGNSAAKQAEHRPAQAERGNGHAAAPAQRNAQRDIAQPADRGQGATRQHAVASFDGDRRVRRVDRVVNFAPDVNRGLIDGCPPGLAKKQNGCMPPGLLKPQGDYRYRQTYYQPDWWGYNSLGGRVYYDDGYLYRLGSNNNVLGYIPLLGGALSIGNPWPSYYEPAPVPSYYTDYFNLGPAADYRYADNVLYRVDPQTSAISAIAALLTGDQFAIGQPMPLGYDVYNVPYAYRDRYYDTPDAYYRYSDGYIYQVDPKTQLIAAAIQLLT